MKITTVAAGLANRQAAHPKHFLVFTGLITAFTGVVASGLGFDSSFEALLPKDSKEVMNANLVREKTGGTRKIVVAIKGKNPKVRLSFARELEKRLKKLKQIRHVDLEFDIEFFKERALWMMSPKALDELIPALEEAVRVSKWQANPLNLHLDEEKERADLEAAWGKVDKIVKKHKGDMPFDAVLTSKDGQYTFMLLFPRIKFIQLDVGRALSEQIQREI